MTVRRTVRAAEPTEQCCARGETYYPRSGYFFLGGAGGTRALREVRSLCEPSRLYIRLAPPYGEPLGTDECGFEYTKFIK